MGVSRYTAHTNKEQRVLALEHATIALGQMHVWWCCKFCIQTGAAAVTLVSTTDSTIDCSDALRQVCPSRLLMGKSQDLGQEAAWNILCRTILFRPCLKMTCMSAWLNG